MNYIQCKIRKEDRNDIAWLQDKNLAVGKIVEIKRGEGVVDGGWEIIEMYGTSSLDKIKKDNYK